MDWIILRFFFDFREGKGIQNSFEGLLRSLLYQLIKEMPQLDALGLDDFGRDSFSDWPEHRLRDALRTSLKNAKKGVCIFADGLDEYEGSVRLLIQFLTSLATSNNTQQSSIKICVSSRPEPEPSQFLQYLPKMSMSDHNASGIRSYCLLTLEGLDPVVRGDPNISRLSHIIAQRAEGVFLWARFALEEIIRGYCEAEDFDELLERLERIPQNLEEVYDRMLGRMELSAKKECIIMLQLVCFAKRSLTWRELLVATETAMDKHKVLDERVYDDVTLTENAAKELNMFAKRLRAKAAGLLEIGKEGEDSNGYQTHVSQFPKLIHKSVRTYLDHKGWQMLGAFEGGDLERHESMYVETCTRYLHRLLRHYQMEKNTRQSVKEWYKGKDFYSSEYQERPGSIGIYPFFSYAAAYFFEHARFLDWHGTSSYPVLHDCLTERLFWLHHIYVCEKGANVCRPCLLVDRNLFSQHFDATYVAFLHGLVSSCKRDLQTRSPAPGQAFWESALECAILASGWWIDSRQVQEALSFALQNVTTVKQLHLEKACRERRGPHPAGALKLVLKHASVKDLRLVDLEGQAVSLFWLLTELDDWYYFEDYLTLLIDRANDRGENMLQRRGPAGNLVETLLEQRPSSSRWKRLQVVRKYYESMSWPFEYDSDKMYGRAFVSPQSLN